MTSRWLAAIALCAVLAGCSDPVEHAYKTCVAKVDDALAASEKDDASQKDAASQAMAPAMREMAKQMGHAACDAMKEMCKQDPNGASCKSAIAEFNK